MKKLLLLLFLVLAPSLSFSQSKVIDESRWEIWHNDNKQIIYFDKENVSYQILDNAFVGWFKWTYKKEEKFNDRVISKEMLKIKFYCDEKKCQYLKTVIYFTDESIEEVEGVDKLEIVPETVLEILFKKICK